MLSGFVCLRRQREPEKDDRFMLPHSRFEGRFLPVNEQGTFEAEMEALDRLDEQEEGIIKESYYDLVGDVRIGVAEIGATKDRSRPLWSKRADAAKTRWQDPECVHPSAGRGRREGGGVGGQWTDMEGLMERWSDGGQGGR